MDEGEATMTATMGRKIGEGRTAEVLLWGDAQVLKLYRPGYPAQWVDYEAKVARWVFAAGLDAPAVGEVVGIDGRRGIVYERLDGPSMLDLLLQQPERLQEMADEFARLHANMHALMRAELPGLVPLRATLKEGIGQASRLTDEVKARACRAVDALPDGDAVCHGDFHPGNILMTARGPVIIDWMSVAGGNPTADVARTVLLFRHSALPPGLSPTAGERLQALRRKFVDTYLEAYARLRPYSSEEMEAWLAPLAAARLRERPPREEEDVLATMAEAGPFAHPPAPVLY
jgi:uncharacterized protein (TIGR02172 family)